MAVRDPDAPELASGKAMGLAVLEALRFHTGFTHMEWYRKADGEAVFGEIAARAPGARTVDVMNFACDVDLFRGWAEAVCHGKILQPIERRYNAAAIFKRARGSGRIQRIEGLSRILSELGHWITAVDLTPLGAPRRDWVQTLISDGFVMLRHPDLRTTLEMADRVGSEVQLIAG